MIGNCQYLAVDFLQIIHSAEGKALGRTGKDSVDNTYHHHLLEFIYAVDLPEHRCQGVYGLLGKQVFGNRRQGGMTGYPLQRLYRLFVAVRTYIFKFRKIYHFYLFQA